MHAGLQVAALALLAELAQHATIQAAMQTAACGDQSFVQLAVSVVQSQDADMSSAALQLVQRMCASRRLLQEVSLLSWLAILYRGVVWGWG